MFNISINFFICVTVPTCLDTNGNSREYLWRPQRFFHLHFSILVKLNEFCQILRCLYAHNTVLLNKHDSLVKLQWYYWLFHLVISCTVFVLICTVVVLNYFVMCVCVCVWWGVGFVMCGCLVCVYFESLRLPWLRFFRAFPSVVKQMPGYTSN
jgi:hypothetical protein